MMCPVCEKPVDFNENFNNALYCVDCRATIFIERVTWDNEKNAKIFGYDEPDAEPEQITD